MVLAAIPDRPKTQAQIRIVTWLMTMATTETIEYRMNLCTDRSPRVGDSTRSTSGEAEDGPHQGVAPQAFVQRRAPGVAARSDGADGH